MKKLLKGGAVLIWIFIAVMGAYVLFKGVALAAGSQDNTKVVNELDYNLNQKAVEMYMPGLAFTSEKAKSFNLGEYIVEKAMAIVPIGEYVKGAEDYETEVESMSTYEMILANEANDENEVDEDGNLVASDDVDHMEEENAQAAKADASSKVEYSLDKLKDFDYLISNFYQVDKTTTIDKSRLNVEKLVKKDLSLSGDNSKPQILIYHTHSQEAFKDSKSGDTSTTIVGVGEYLTEILTEQYGYNVMHHTGVYDMVKGKLDRNQAYTLAGKAVEKILKENPSIEVVIDLHRDGVAESTHLVTEVNGKQTAQFMFFNGLSRTTANGDISYLKNPYIEDNLALSLQMQLEAAQYYPGVARKIYLKGYRYNLHMKEKSLLVEAGAQTNTFEEVKNAMEPIADVLHKVLEK